MGRDRIEWPTWGALLACYGTWGAVTAWHADLGPLWVIPAALLVTFHSSIQHEVLHGHPTRIGWLNEALVYPALGLFVPYRRFKDLHLRHHNNDLLTDPHDDPESFYVAETDHDGLPAVLRLALAANATLLGRLTVGPFLALPAFWIGEVRMIRAGVPGVARAWAHHALGLAAVLAWLWAVGIPLWVYLPAVALPGYAVLLLRSYLEHRADPDPARRSAIVEPGPVFGILFLNNSFHALHHERPALSWYKLPRLWRHERDAVLARNGGYHLPGYGAVLRQWLLRRREPVVHPFLRRRP